MDPRSGLNPETDGGWISIRKGTDLNEDLELLAIGSYKRGYAEIRFAYEYVVAPPEGQAERWSAQGPLNGLENRIRINSRTTGEGH